MLATSQLVVPANAAIDLQLHTQFSDGHWTAEALLAHLTQERFALGAITDHDRPDTAAQLQQQAAAVGFPLLVATEMSTCWRDAMVDLLCFGFALNQETLTAVARDLWERQAANIRSAYASLCASGLLIESPAALQTLLAAPSAQQPHDLVALLQAQGLDRRTAGQAAWNAGCTLITSNIATVVEAAHASGAVCILAHPGRDDGFVCFDSDLLDQLRSEVPIDGLEVYYPRHTPAQTAMYHDYASIHDLLISAGSDSHSPEQPPRRYAASQCQRLLERLGITVEPVI